MSKPWSASILSLFALACVACGADPTASEPGGAIRDEAIINGQFTFERPEIGYINSNLGFCTATLVAPNVVLSAAHCIGYRTEDHAGQRIGDFVVQFSESDSRVYTFDAMISYGHSGPSTTDVALLRLTDPVPPSVAVPATIATQHVPQGHLVTWFGYGCGNRATPQDSQTYHKQRLTFTLQASNNSCLGDSGGPTVRDVYGDVFRVTSGWRNGRDVFGDVVSMRPKLMAQIDIWNAQAAPSSPGLDAVRVHNATGAALWVRCPYDAAPNCSEWTHLSDGTTREILTPDWRLLLDNQDWLPGAKFSWLNVLAPGDVVSVYANASDPFTPLPSGEVTVTNGTGAPLFVRCEGNPSPSCTDWTHMIDGSTAVIRTPNRRMYLDNQNWLPGAKMSWLAVTAPSDVVTVYPNVSHPFSP